MALAIMYIAVLAEFFNPAFNVNVEIKYDALVLTAIVLGFLYVFFRRAKHH